MFVKGHHLAVSTRVLSQAGVDKSVDSEEAFAWTAKYIVDIAIYIKRELAVYRSVVIVKGIL